MTEPLFGNSRITNCTNCGRIVVGNRFCQCVSRRHVPTNAEWVRGPRKPFPDRATLTDRLVVRAALAFYRAFVAVSEWRKERK